MASMSPNPFLAPLQNSTAPAIAPPPAFVPPPPPMYVTPSPIDAPAVFAPQPAAAPSVGELSIPKMDATLGPPTLLAPPFDPALDQRRARLARLVKGVVGVSALVCVIAIARAAFGGSNADVREPDVNGAHGDAAPAQLRDDRVTTTVRAEIDALSARTLDALNDASRHAPARFTASRGHKRW